MSVLLPLSTCPTTTRLITFFVSLVLSANRSNIFCLSLSFLLGVTPDDDTDAVDEVLGGGVETSLSSSEPLVDDAAVAKSSSFNRSIERSCLVGVR